MEEVKHNDWLVVSTYPSEKYAKVSWDYSSQVPNHQPDEIMGILVNHGESYISIYIIINGIEIPEVIDI